MLSQSQINRIEAAVINTCATANICPQKKSNKVTSVTVYFPTRERAEAFQSTLPATSKLTVGNIFRVMRRSNQQILFGVTLVGNKKAA